MTKEIMEQYEAVRQSGACNMFNYNCVTNVAETLGFDALAEVSFDKYKDILMNFEKYMKQFDIKQGEPRRHEQF